MSYSSLAAHVRAYIGQDHRYQHSVRVARCADLLAQRHGLDAGKARLAGMLHDVARLYSGPKLIAECEERQMPVSAFERTSPIVLHARLGAVLAREVFDVHDPEVLSAIAKHTTGDAEMSDLDCAVYLADSLEPGREFAEREALWQRALRDLSAGMRGVLRSSFAYLSRKGIPAARQTLGAARRFGVNLEEVGVSAS